MTESKVPDKSGNSRLAEMRNINIEKKNGICGKSIVLKERPLLYQAKNASTSKESVKSLNLTVAAWIFLLVSWLFIVTYYYTTCICKSYIQINKFSGKKEIKVSTKRLIDIQK